LSIVAQIAMLHGGTVALEERDGGGTVARLVLPTG
jgi:signal transduction histidine kinase